MDVNLDQLIGIMPSAESILDYTYNHLTLVIMVLVFIIIFSIINHLIMTPTDYYLDMTTEKYCKRLMEMNNDYDEIDRKKPFVYPNGWLPIVESCLVKPGQIKDLAVMGRDLIVTRCEDTNKVSVLDAYCPHMGVHIGIGGQVRSVQNESCIECPFHKWTFRTSDGMCVRIPYQENGSKIPVNARLKKWISDEVDEYIYIWHHRENRSPNWWLQPVEQIANKSWTLAGKSNHLSNLDMRDMHENGADMNHFAGIHNDLFLFGGYLPDLQSFNFLQRYVRHCWDPKWQPFEQPESYKARMTLNSWIRLFNFRVFDICVEAHQIGPAKVNLYYDSNLYGTGVLTMNGIPLGGRRVKYCQNIYTKRNWFQFFMSKWVLLGEILMIERDFYIWNHKKNTKNPLFVAEDKTIKEFRRWYKQFYSDDDHIKSDNKITINQAALSLF